MKLIKWSPIFLTYSLGYGCLSDWENSLFYDIKDFYGSWGCGWFPLTFYAKFETFEIKKEESPPTRAELDIKEFWFY